MNLLRLRSLIKEKNITGKLLAQELGFTQNTVSNLINGKSFPSGKDLKRIADYLEVDIKDLFNTTKEPEVEPDTPFYIKDEQGNEKVVGSLKVEPKNQFEKRKWRSG